MSLISLAESVVELLREGDDLALYRARRPGNAEPVLLLVSSQVEESPATLRRLENEYSLAAVLDPEWAVRPLAMAQHEGKRALVLEDGPGESLDRLIGKPFELKRFLHLAVALTSAVRGVHKSGLVHKDIKPAHVLVADDDTIRLMGFGFASRSFRGDPAPVPPGVITGTFAYMSPEQTGRMNRVIDTRSDLYSLGITLYELMTGVLPFTASEPMEWIHCHLARSPTPPSQRISDMPEAVEAIILKLLAKNPEDRYQTAAGVEGDLQRCLAQWHAQSRIDPFALADDVPADRLVIPEKLYGRQAAMDTLVAAFDRVASTGKSELVLVSGYAGIGKSSVVYNFRNDLARRGLFAIGKVDQHDRYTPYATLGQAFESLVHQILAKTDAELGQWRAALSEALGSHAQLMVDLIPDLDLVIGQQPLTQEVSPTDAKNRFQAIFRRLLAVFARRGQPLILFLDDLQWLDTATLDLIKHLMTEPDVVHLLLIGAYRDNEIEHDHPLELALKQIRSYEAPTEIVLPPLNLDELTLLVADALQTVPASAQHLADLISKKTGGNPFFAIQFMTTLVDDKLIAFDDTALIWRWDTGRIQTQGMADNVAELMASRLNRLAPVAQTFLKQLACLGNRARAAKLVQLLEMPEADMQAIVVDLVHAGLIRRNGDEYAFLHDRIQEAAYALIPEGERAAEHLRIGRVLVTGSVSVDIEEDIFEIVNQLNRGATAITSEGEYGETARLNLIAGKRAKASTAFAAAFAYSVQGCALLPADSWARHYHLTFDLELLRAECEFLIGDFAAAAGRLIALKARAKDVADHASIVCVGVLLHLATRQIDHAVAMGLEFLERVGVRWSIHPTDEEVRQEYDRTLEKLAGRPIESLVSMPKMTDTECLATIDVLSELMPASDDVDLNLQSMILLRMTNLSLEYGNSDASCVAYAALSIVLGPRFGAYQVAYRFGHLAMDLVDRFGFDRFKARVYACYSVFVQAWTRPLPVMRPLMQRAHELANTSGDVTFASYSYRHLVTNLMVSGVVLSDVQREAERSLEFLRKAGFAAMSESTLSRLDLIRSLRGLIPFSRGHAEAEPGDERRALHSETRPQTAMSDCLLWIDNLQQNFFAQDLPAAIEAAEQAASLLWSMRTLFELTDYHYYSALTRAAACDSASDEQRRKYLDMLRDHHTQFVVWSQSCLETFANCVALVAAEIARLEGQPLEAERLYEEAIRSARENGLVQNEGVANELAARFYAMRGFTTIADAYRRNARACYVRWGAEGKVRQMDQAYPELRREAAAERDGATGTAIENLDLTTIVNVLQAISREIDIAKLIDTVMTNALEHAGGDRGLLILLRGNVLEIEAEAISRPDKVVVNRRQGPALPNELPESILRYVIRTLDTVLLDDAHVRNRFSDDGYVAQKSCRSLLCVPLIKQGSIAGVLYLENTLTSHVFTPARISVLGLLASQAAISLENARLYSGLRRAEAYLNEAQVLSQTGSFGWNVSTGAIYWSPEMFKIYGYDPQEVVTLDKALARTHPDDITRLRVDVRAAAREGRDWQVEFRLLMPDGSVKHVNCVMRAARDEAGGLEYLGACMDVTEAKRTQERVQGALAETKLAQHRLEEAQRIAQLGNWVWTLSTNRILLSDEHCRIFGFTHEELDTNLGRALDTIHPEDRDRVRGTVEAAVRAGQAFSCEFRIVSSDGSVKYVHSRGGPSQTGASGDEYVGTVLDVTERKRYEEEMQKLVSLIENSADFIGYSSTAGTVEYVNAGGRRLLGLALEDDVTTFRMADFHAPGTGQWFDEEVYPALSRDGHWEGEHTMRHLKTNSAIPVLQTIFFVTDPATRRRIGIATICRDISERKRIDESLRASLKEKDALLKEVHHRVKNNLQLISSLLSLQAGRVSDPVAAAGFAESCNRLRSMALVHENLYRAGNFARVPIAAHVRNLCAHLMRAYSFSERNVELITEVDDVELDLDRAITTGLIVNELVSNSLKHAFPGDRSGRIQVELRLVSRTQYALTVMDDGVGLPFDFDPESSDTLGLQLVHDLTRQLQGTISARRESGTGFAIMFSAGNDPET